MKIGERIRSARQQRGYSQGDLEDRTGLLRCYLSRVENGHTEPSLQTLVRIATALEMPLVGFFNEPGDVQDTAPPPPQLSEHELAFLTQIRQYSTSLSENDRQQVLNLARKMAAAGAK